jgi:two-component system phosphate regulon sensor histidine kinase PhoR
MSFRTAYPWFFFYRIAKLTLIVFLPTLFLILFLYRSSYRSGLVAQMTVQIEEDLKLLRHTFAGGKLDWIKWCRDLPPLKDVQYSLLRKDGTILCDSLHEFKTGQRVDDSELLRQISEAQFSSALKKSSLFKTQAVVAGLRLSDELVIRKVIPVSSLKNNMDRFDRVLFLRIVPFALLSYFIFIFLFYRQTKPLGVVLSKVDKFKDDIPFNKNLELLYERDEWSEIVEALNEADLRLQRQIVEFQIENEKNSAILESINDDIIAIDRFESILFYNSRFRKDFFIEREGLEINKKIWHIFENEVLFAFRCVLREGSPQSLKAIRFPQSHKPNSLFDLTITPLMSTNGTINGALGVFYDITEFKLAEQMRVDFVANVSHEIRTPLTSIKGFTQILESQNDKVDPVLRPFLEKIISNTERMISLFNDLLNLSVIESGSKLKLEEFSLPEVIEDIKQNIKANYPDREINFESHLKIKTIKGDQRLIEQVILNLCDNACKYAHSVVTITITSEEIGKKVILRIQDNGPGISSEHLSRIFERFYRIDASRESLRGTGLGLAIVKQIISKHNGRIWAESEGLGHGTTFSIELPSE